MAGLGWKLWTRERLSQSDLQGYVQDQVVMRFASAAARTTAIASPSEGMFSYLLDVNRLDYHDGTAWKPWTAAYAQAAATAVAFGSPAASGQPLTIQAWSAVVNTNAGGDVTINYPAAFPSGVASVQMTPGDISGGFGFVAGTGAALSSCTARCYTPTGGAVVSIPVRIQMLVVGW